MSSVFGGLLFFIGLLLTGTGIVLLATATGDRPWWMWGLLIGGVILLIIGIFTWMFMQEATIEREVEIEMQCPLPPRPAAPTCPLPPRPAAPIQESPCYRDVQYTQRVPCGQEASQYIYRQGAPPAPPTRAVTYPTNLSRRI